MDWLLAALTFAAAVAAMVTVWLAWQSLKEARALRREERDDRVLERMITLAATLQRVAGRPSVATDDWWQARRMTGFLLAGLPGVHLPLTRRFAEPGTEITSMQGLSLAAFGEVSIAIQRREG